MALRAEARILVFVRSFKHILAAALALAGAAGHAQTAQGAPERVVSMNVCTDQLAMMLAAPGQLYSVSMLATDPRASAMVEEAKGYDANAGRAEEVYLMKPDLVLAGSFSARASVDMLERLGIRVIRFDPAYALGDVEARIRQMGAALGRQTRAEELIASYQAGLERLRPKDGEERPRAVQYVANGYTQGSNTLSDEMLEAAGFSNLSAELGIKFGARMPLEMLALHAPDLVVTAAPYPGASRSEEIPNHPVVKRITEGRPPMRMHSPDWLCGTPHVLGAIEALAAEREKVLGR